MGPLLALLEPLRVLLEHLSGSLGRPPGDLLGGLLGVPKPTLKHPQSWRANYSENWAPASTGTVKNLGGKNPPAPRARSDRVALPPPGPSPLSIIYFYLLKSIYSVPAGARIHNVQHQKRFPSSADPPVRREHRRLDRGFQ